MRNKLLVIFVIINTGLLCSAQDQAIDIVFSDDDISNKNIALNQADEQKNIADTDIQILSESDFYAKVVNGFSFLLGVLTLLIGIFTAIGFSLFLSINKTKKELGDIKANFPNYTKLLEDRTNELIKLLNSHYTQRVKVDKGKKNILDMLADGTINKERMYNAIQDTVQYPDIECINLYGKILAIKDTENDIDIIRLIRNGLLSFKGIYDSTKNMIE